MGAAQPVPREREEDPEVLRSHENEDEIGWMSCRRLMPVSEPGREDVMIAERYGASGTHLHVFHTGLCTSDFALLPPAT